MKFLALNIFLLPLIFFSGCKKNDLPPKLENASSVFYIKGNINNTAVELKAGENGYYMSSSYYQDANNVYVYKGELNQRSCNGPCGYGITILINDFKESPSGAVMKPDSGLYIGSFQFNDGSLTPVMYSGIFTPIIGNSNTSYTWTYSDGQVQTTQQGARKFNAGKTYSIGLTLNNNGCVQSHTNEFRIGSPLQTNISALCNWTATPATYSFYASSSAGLIPQWNFGDLATSSAITPVHTYGNFNKYYTARLRLTNSNNDTCYSYYQVPVSLSSPVCHANYNSFFTAVPNTKALSSITILVTDPSGKIYSSQNINQSVNNKIEIVAIEDYKNNAQDQRTKKVKIRFNCDVANGAEMLKISNGEAVIAVAYK